MTTTEHSFDLAPTTRGGGRYKPPRRMSGIKPPRRLSGANINQKTKKMQNKPNLYGFWAENHDSTQKFTRHSFSEAGPAELRSRKI